MTEPTNGLAPENEAGKFDEHVAATIRTAVDEWRTGNNPADVHGVSMPECIRRSLADAGLLAPYHRTHSLCLEWDDTRQGFAIISDRAEASRVVVLLDTVRQVMQERDLALALQRAGFRSMKDQVDAMGRQIKAQQAQLDQAIKGEQLARLRRYVRDLTESVPDISGDDNLSTEDAYNRGYADADVATGKALGALLDVKFNEVLDSPELRAVLTNESAISQHQANSKLEQNLDQAEATQREPRKWAWDDQDHEPDDCTRVVDETGLLWTRDAQGLWGATNHVSVTWWTLARKRGQLTEVLPKGGLS